MHHCFIKSYFLLFEYLRFQQLFHSYLLIILLIIVMTFPNLPPQLLYPLWLPTLLALFEVYTKHLVQSGQAIATYFQSLCNQALGGFSMLASSR